MIPRNKPNPITVTIPCPTCDGSGKDPETGKECLDCNSVGKVIVQQKVGK